MRTIEARALSYALEIGAVSIESVQAWADGEILRDNSPDHRLLTLANERLVASAISLLHELGDGADGSATSRRVFRYLLNALSEDRISHAAAATVLVRLAREGAVPSVSVEGVMWSFPDEFALAEARRAGNSKDVAKRFEAFLRRHAA